MLLEMQTQLQSSNVAFLKPQTCCWKACISKHYVSNHILIVIKALFGLVSLSLPWSDSHASFHSGSSVCVGFGLFSLKSKSLFLVEIWATSVSDHKFPEEKDLKPSFSKKGLLEVEVMGKSTWAMCWVFSHTKSY
jgi:hypothetical protein